ncbi:hypothetical protein [Candidatus Soleaferrea massiliensis]|uniref:hypothetical protein n=1 Tax=Candidatus Soleaferrea massiliensis TaxID=1470354 RepID=UPI00058E0909|nr:hypothetical protein [Candidatus Soleaferrea massiliensis]
MCMGKVIPFIKDSSAESSARTKIEFCFSDHVKAPLNRAKNSRYFRFIPLYRIGPFKRLPAAKQMKREKARSHLFRDDPFELSVCFLMETMCNMR